MKLLKIISPILILMLLTACGGGQSDQSAVETQVAALLNQQATTSSSTGGVAQPTAVATSAVQGEQATVDPLIVIPEDASCTPDNSPRVTAIVGEIWSGDSFQANVNGQGFEVRLIGIDSGDLPADTLTQLVAGKTVLLITDTTDLDEFGRLARYVIADGVFVNAELIRRGAAYVAFGEDSPDMACAQTFCQLEPGSRDCQ